MISASLSSLFRRLDLQGRAAVSESPTSIRTSNVSVVSHTHGKERRLERGIDKIELQEAVKYGQRKYANPGRDGARRFKFTHKGIVYITDETMRHEITSWRIADAIDESTHAEIGSNAAIGSHTVVVVDSSGSMRKDDVPGYNSRTEAVYDCLARDFVEPQLKVFGADTLAVVTLIEMSDKARVIFQRRQIDADLLHALKSREHSRASSHGNYLPALDKVLEVLRQDANQGTQLFMLFLSDGAPSDHVFQACEHDVLVWQPPKFTRQFRGRLGKPELQSCGGNVWHCRKEIQESVKSSCVRKITTLGDMFGRDRMFVGTVAFGNPDDDYSVLKRMAEALPRGSFQKLGLSALNLRTAFSSLTSSLTSLRTEGGSSSLTQREVPKEEKGTTPSNGWDVYYFSVGNVVSKEKYNVRTGSFERIGYEKQSVGVAISKKWHAAGAERQVYHCMEIKKTEDGGQMTLTRTGQRLIAKETKHVENLKDNSFHTKFCKVQGEAQVLAELFNRRVQGACGTAVACQLNFLACVLYTVKDSRWTASGGVARVLAEPELEGQFTKWNNNAGAIKSRPLPCNTAAMVGWRLGTLGAIGEGSEDEEEELSGVGIDVNDVPQCFSHFSYTVTNGSKLVCDLQGVWNAVDGFVLTDPVMHTYSPALRQRAMGKTDKGKQGMTAFFKTHKCNSLCRRLGLSSIVL